MSAYTPEFNDYWQRRSEASWRGSLTESERLSNKPMPAEWGGAFKRHAFEAWQAAMACVSSVA